MFTEKTVFILGAGASWHYGYPTGEDLIKAIKIKAGEVAHFFVTHGNWIQWFCLDNMPEYFLRKNTYLTQMQGIDAYGDFVQECNEFVRRLDEINPLVIDYFLEKNDSLQDIGKLMISWVILEHERKYLAQNRRNDRDWYRFILHEILQDCQDSKAFCNNKVAFITFNYDVSLEHRLSKSLSQIDLITPKDKNSFLNEDLVLHIYGKVRHNAFDIERYGKISDCHSSEKTPLLHRYEAAINLAWSAAQQIKTIPEAKKEDIVTLNKAHKNLEEAKHIYILGYGFDKSNNKRLGLENIQQNGKRVHFTNFNNSNRINKRAGEIFKDDGAFIEQSIVRGNTSFGNEHIANIYEKSTRDVYGALDLDFE